ncbi:MAG: CDP-alcohol phosphatidyltransferase family protein [Candidatus Nanoarchaeia archaeon]|nr:CDP-alcohol phosphatidyltransferase family protein [Candidatus Nanoarchaeia archaeon]
MFKLSEDMEGVKKEDINAVLLRRISRKIAVFIAKKLKNTLWITPTGITFFVALLYILCALSLYFATTLSYIAAGILFILAYIFDQVDGSLSRIRETATEAGGFLDHTFDNLGVILLFIGATLGLINTYGEFYPIFNINLPSIWLFSLLGITAYLLQRFMYESFRRLFAEGASTEIEKAKSKINFIKNFFYDGPMIVYGFVLGSILTAFIPKFFAYVLIFFGVYGWLFCLVSFREFYKRGKRIVQKTQ